MCVLGGGGYLKKIEVEAEVKVALKKAKKLNSGTILCLVQFNRQKCAHEIHTK